MSYPPAFDDRVVIVTGGAQGIGEGCVRAFHEAGAHIAILDRQREVAAHLAESLCSAEAGRVVAIACDVANSQQFGEAVAAIIDQFGRIDCLVNNAGMHPPALTLADTHCDVMRQLLEVNFMSTFIGCQLVMPYLKETEGTIVNISSMTAVLGQRHSTAYCATKAAQVGFTKSLAIEAGEYNVRVNAILPSNVETPLMHSWAKTLPDPETALEEVAQLQVLGRMASALEIGRVARFLASSESSFLTGVALETDGGASLDY